MKKITFLLAFVAVAMFANAADWVETFGPDDVAKNESGYWPYVSGTGDNYVYTNYDHVADCVYAGYSASVRKVTGIGNHVWLAAPKPADPPKYPNPSDSWLSISGIEAAGAQYVSFDLAPNADGYTPNMKLWINGVEVAMPSVTLATMNVMQNVGDIAIASADVYEIKFQNFDAAQGIRIDNVTFKGTTPIKNVTIDNSVYATNGTVYAEGEFQIFSVAGQNVTELNGQLNGIYVVKTAKGIQKVAVK
jgi:hypothetical protein